MTGSGMYGAAGFVAVVRGAGDSVGAVDVVSLWSTWATTFATALAPAVPKLWG